MGISHSFEYMEGGCDEVYTNGWIRQTLRWDNCESLIVIRVSKQYTYGMYKCTKTGGK